MYLNLKKKTLGMPFFLISNLTYSKFDSFHLLISIYFFSLLLIYFCLRLTPYFNGCNFQSVYFYLNCFLYHKFFWLFRKLWMDKIFHQIYIGTFLKEILKLYKSNHLNPLLFFPLQTLIKYQDFIFFQIIHSFKHYFYYY